jgi:4-carboxymuconolactone decarboxylase
MIRDELFDRGLDMRRQMFGPRGAEGIVDNVNEYNDALEDYVTRLCFGDVWQREALGHRDRSLATVSMLAALGRGPELEVHMRGAVANGVTIDELRELIMHTALYCGIPAAVGVYRALQRVVDGTAIAAPSEEK